MPSDTPSNITIGTTNVSLNNIKNAFIGTTTILSHYYRGGTNIYNTTRLSTIPTSGPISFGNFKNTTNVIQQTTSTPNENIATMPSLYSHYMYFYLPTDKIKIISINFVSFSANISGSRTTILNILNTFKPVINSTVIIGSLSINDNAPTYLVKTTITNNYVYLLNDNPNYNAVSMKATSTIPGYTSGSVLINFTYIK